MSDNECDWDFSGRDDAKAEIRAAVRYLLHGAQVPIAMSLRWKLWKLCARSACRRLSSAIRWTTVCLVVRRGTEARTLDARLPSLGSPPGCVGGSN